MIRKKKYNQSQSQNGESKEFTILFLETSELTEEDLENEDDEDEDDDFDFNPNSLSTKQPRKRNVEIRIVETGEQDTIRCRLPWTWKWLRARVKLKVPPYKGNQMQLLKDGMFQVLEYQLDPRTGDSGRAAINLLFTSICDSAKKQGEGDPDSQPGDVMEYERREFGQFLSLQPPKLCSLTNLENLLDSFEKQMPSAAHQLRHVSNTQLPGKIFSLAIQQPVFFKSAPVLYPKKLGSIVDWDENEDANRRHKQEAFLRTLEQIATEEPWKFGFSDIMYNETKFSGLEAQYSAIKSVWWFDNLSDLQKAALLTYDMFKHTCRDKGHTYLKHDDIKTNFKFYTSRVNNNEDEQPNQSTTTSAIEFLIEHEIVRRQVKDAVERFHLMRYWKAEESICNSLEEIMTADAIAHKVDLQDERFSRIQSDKAQMTAARCILEKPVTLVSGRGGTGKTEVVSAVLKALEEYLKTMEAFNDDMEEEEHKKVDSMMSEDGVNSDDSHMSKDIDPLPVKPAKKASNDNMNGPILYCAPTGKAASVIKKRVGSKAFTIHQVISSYKLWKSSDQQSPWKFSAVRIVAVDECSMVSIEVIQWLLRYMLEGSKLTKVVLLGDHQQLPSVEPGNFMEDLFKALKTRGMTVTLMTNHRSEGSIIFDNATKIARQQMPTFNADQGFVLIIPSNENINKVPRHLRPHVRQLKPSASIPPDTPRNWSRGRPREISEDKKSLYWSLLKDYRPEFRLEDDEKSHIITFVNAECAEVNNYGCWIYNKHNTWELDRNNRQVKNFHVGDKIICTKNSDVPVIVPEEEEDGKGNADDGGGQVSHEMEEGNAENPVNFLQYTGATDGKFEEDPNIKLKMTNDRLMNGNLYKIRAEVTGKVTCKSEDDEGNSNGGKDDKRPVSMSYWVLDDLAGDIVRICPKALIKKTKITHAWALTIHKFQGSEADTIVYGLSGSGYEHWQHVYTAVTRGKKKVVIVGSYEDLEKAVKKRPFPRQTALEEKVKKLLTRVEKEKKKKEEEETMEDEEAEVMKDKKNLQNLFPEKSNQTAISSYFSPSKVSKTEQEKSPSVGSRGAEASSNPPLPITPNKLSQELSTSMRLSNNDEWMADLTEDFDEVDSKIAISPGKRKGPAVQNTFSPSKLLKENFNKTWGINEMEFTTSTQVRGKRAALESPATLRTACRTQSPRSYPPRTSSKQPSPLVAGQQLQMGDFGDFDDDFEDVNCSLLEKEAMTQVTLKEEAKNSMISEDEDDAFGDFDGINCSMLEQEAIMCSQRDEAKRNIANVFGISDDDEFGDEDGVSDDELADAVR